MERRVRATFPVFRHELRRLFRRSHAFWFLVASVAATGTGTVLAWPAARSAGFGGYWESYVARLTLSWFFAIELVLSIIIVPAVVADAIAGERERGTWELIATSLLSPVRYAAAKASASTTWIVLWFATTFPLLASVLLLGGVSLGAIARAAVVVLAALVASVAICLAISAGRNRTTSSLRRGIASLIAWHAAPFLLGILSGPHSPSSPLLLSPFFAFGCCLWGAPSTLGADLEPWVIFTFVAAIIVAVHTFLLVERCRGRPFALNPVHVPDPYQAPPPAFPKGRRRELGSGRWFFRTSNPLLAKELAYRTQWTPVATGTKLFLPFFAAFFFKVGIQGLSPVSRTDDAMTLLLGANASLFLLPFTVIFSRRSGIAAEGEHGTLDLLLGTKLRAVEVTDAKIGAALYSGLPLLLGGFAVHCLGLLVLTGSEDSFRLADGGWRLAMYPVAAVTVLGVSCAAASLSASVARRGLAEITFSVILLVVLFVGVPLGIATSEALSPVEVESLVVSSPFAAYGITVLDRYRQINCGVSASMLVAWTFIVFVLLRAGAIRAARRRGFGDSWLDVDVSRRRGLRRIPVDRGQREREANGKSGACETSEPPRSIEPT